MLFRYKNIFNINFNMFFFGFISFAYINLQKSNIFFKTINYILPIIVIFIITKKIIFVKVEIF